MLRYVSENSRLQNSWTKKARQTWDDWQLWNRSSNPWAFEGNKNGWFPFVDTPPSERQWREKICRICYQGHCLWESIERWLLYEQQLFAAFLLGSLHIHTGNKRTKSSERNDYASWSRSFNQTGNIEVYTIFNVYALAHMVPRELLVTENIGITCTYPSPDGAETSDFEPVHIWSVFITWACRQQTHPSALWCWDIRVPCLEHLGIRTWPVSLQGTSGLVHMVLRH